MKQKISGLGKDFIACNLRSQVMTLQTLLDSIESVNDSECSYALESLKRVEAHIRKLRNFLDS